MAEKRIFSRLNRWWRTPGQPGAGDPLGPGAEPEGGEAGSDPGSANDANSQHQSPRDHYTSDVLPPEVEAAGQEALEAEVENLNRKLEKKQQHLEGLLAQRNELHQQLRAAQESIARLEAQLKQRESQTEAAASAQLEYLAKSNQHLIAERDAALNRLQDLGSKLTQNQAGHEALLREREVRIAALEADLAARSRALEEALRAKQELSNRIATLEQDLERGRATQEELKKAHEETQHALTLAVEAADAHKRAEGSIAALQAELSAAQAELTRRQAELEKLRQRAAAAPAPPPAPAPAEAFDLTSELAEAATASPAAPEAPPAAKPAAPYPPIVSPLLPEESGEPAIFEFSGAPEEAAPEPVAAEPVPDPPQREKKLVLVAEDDPSIRRLIELALQKAGHDVITAEDGEEAFQKAITERPDAVLTDMMMPRMNGLELTSQLKKTPLTARIPVGFLTAQRELEYYKGALDLGSRLYITKPFRPDSLVLLVNLLLTGKKKPPGPGRK